MFVSMTLFVRGQRDRRDACGSGAAGLSNDTEVLKWLKSCIYHVIQTPPYFVSLCMTSSLLSSFVLMLSNMSISCLFTEGTPGVLFY